MMKFEAGDRMIKFEAGDRVIDLRYGVGKVTQVTNKGNIYTKFDCGDVSIAQYVQGGFVTENDLFPMIYHVEGFIPPSCKEPDRKPAYEFKPFDRVLCRDVQEQPWRADFFSGIADDFFIGVAHTWAEMIPYEGNEDKCGKVTE